jgi:drug/metabolite transporter (DMT)-like permease
MDNLDEDRNQLSCQISFAGWIVMVIGFLFALPFGLMSEGEKTPDESTTALFFIGIFMIGVLLHGVAYLVNIFECRRYKRLHS